MTKGDICSWHIAADTCLIGTLAVHDMGTYHIVAAQGKYQDV